ncbi:TPA: putative holin-like toxin [Streptococcus suis 2524]|uniref:putative holin-like toxin n=1 Tax=Streptococcus suis TaxID=1307 RepID=UPI00040906CB|nr:putative holin-like toxin [Streptococcus suis]MDW8745281.1 putative holin-like toxin [Streptococcus suis]MDY7282923.1 putative holin-like toxin [Streptococcus suis]NQG77297.1 putative holin-like toxin [Streptococcus suis]NQH59535.1 putative holin-like toxin [Streptococcus suis]NQN47825.1 putative holin-like toxin [Streptococcus suis]
MKNIVSKIKRRGLISAFEVVQTILAFGGFTIALIIKSSKKMTKNNPSPLLTELLDEL